MPDHLSKAARSRNMAAVRGKDTEPELVLRRMIHRMGFRYGLHSTDLPGKPDLVFRSRRRVIFLHGCFWHRHPGCSRSSTPVTNVDFWAAKFHANMERDRHAEKALSARGFESLVVWQCELKDPEKVARRVRAFLSKGEREGE